MTMNTRFNFVLNFAAIALVAGWTAKAAEPVVVENLQSITATVEAIDVNKRLVTLRGPEGRTETIEVPPEARNLAQVKVGDKLVVKYYQSVGASLTPKAYAATTSGNATTAVAGARAAPGAKPAGVVGGTVSATVTIQSVDSKTNTVSFTGPEGMVRNVQVKDPAAQKFVATLKKGDLVDLTYTEALAVSVEAAK
jgi:hypothetical protein